MSKRDEAQPDLDMSEWRAAIDKFDDEILNLIKGRLALSEQVGKSKVRGGLPWRPAREAQLFARLVGRASSTLSPQAVERLWSTVIAQSLQAQGPAFLLVSKSHPKLSALARTFFGLLPLERVDDDATAIARCAKEEGAIAIVPAPGEGVNWWVELAQLNEGSDLAPAVLAALPRFASDTPPAAYAIAVAPREYSGNDSVWLVGAGQKDDMPPGTVLAQKGDLHLMAFDGKTAPEPREGLCQIGLFANPLEQN
ncbi:MAG: chorismate mutase [Robiginitomaculum sp.]|nr:chorismate mutase [Robiginitomaculum sp.]MDQ7078814.1 chorismate mutase [Robiginitomaculum sp.]